MPQNTDNSMNDLDRIREILLEPGFSEMFNKITKVEEKVDKGDLGALPELKKDIDKVKNDLELVKSDIAELMNFVQGFNKKITTAFKSISG
ncbi:MAG: hypothetical protein ABIA63_09945 [bacterium]